MEANECVMGTRVALVAKKAPFLKGKIAGVVSPGKKGPVVIVDFDNGSLQKIQISTLILESVAPAAEQKAKEEAELEKQRQIAAEKARQAAEAATEASCKEKLKQAAALIIEAGKLARSNDMELREMWDAVSPLEHAMSDQGWNTSSWNC